MPKSGFDPTKHQRKHAHRYNPLSKSTPSSSAAPSPASAASSTLEALQQASKTATSSSSVKNDIIPLLANLPESSNTTATPINLADKVWALASVSLLLTTSPTQTPSQVKAHRKLLLSHNLIGRLILALQSHTEVDVRREASGALRNLCVDAGVDVRNEVVNKGGVDAILNAIRWSSNALGFDSSAAATNPTASFVDDTPTLEQDLQAKRELLTKPLEKLNKKEKRHLTKLATALGKTLEQIAGQGLSPEDEAKLLSSSDTNANADEAMDTTSPSAKGRGEPFLTLDSNTRKGLIEMAENLVTVVWCLCESGDKAFAKLVHFKWIDSDIVGAGSAGEELSGQGLADWLSSAIALGSRAAKVLSTANADGTRSNQTSTGESLSVLNNEELSLLLDLALASGNALCALMDGGEAEFVDGFLSRRTYSPAPPKPSKKKTPKSDRPPTISAPAPMSIHEQPAPTTRRLASIATAITLLQACVETDQNGIDKLQRYVLSQTTMLGVLSAGVFRNLASSVDAKSTSSSFRTKSSRKHSANTSPPVTSNHIFVPTSGSNNAAEEGGQSLKKYEAEIMLPTLTKLLASVDMVKLAHDLEGRADLSEVVSFDGKEVDEVGLRAKMQGRAEEKAQTLMLALEVLAEMVGTLDTDTSSSSGNVGDDGEGEGEWLEDLETEDNDEEMNMDDEEEEDSVSISDKDSGSDDEMDTRVVVSNNGGDTFADALKRSGTLPFPSYSPILTSLFITPTFTQTLLNLCRPFEASFPSLTSPSPSSHKPTSNLLRGLHSRSLSVLNNTLLRLASFSPPPPSQPASDPKIVRRIAAFRSWTKGSPQKEVLEGVWGVLFDVAKGCACAPAVASSSSENFDTVSAGGGNGEEGKDGLAMVEVCIGTLWSIARIFEGTVPLSTTTPLISVSNPNAATESEIISALTSGYSSASNDSMRVKCILLLSTIARSPVIHPNLNGYIGNFLVTILEQISDSGGNGTTAESMVAAINGIIDTYADENSHYDKLAFRQAGLLGRLRLTLYRCKGVAKRVDRRKQISLRASAEEAVENLVGFLEYRQSLRF